jgi:effector-binding domain-containing protein
LKQPVPIGFLGIQWPYLSFLGKPFRGSITAYTTGYAYQVLTNSLNVQGGLISREITYTDPATNKPVSYLKETYVTVCK